MAAPLQLSINLNEIVKKLIATSKDICNFPRDSADIAARFRRELGRTEFYDGVMKHKVLGGSGTIISATGDQQRASLIESVQDVRRDWEEFITFVTQPATFTSPATGPADTAEPAETTITQAQSRSGASRGIYWAVRGKSRAKRLLDQVHLSNEYLKDSIQEICRYLDQLNPEASSSLVAFSEAVDQSRAGLAVNITRLSIQQGRVPTNMTLLRDKGFLNPLNEIGPGVEPNLRQTLAAGSKPVLIECVASEDFLPTAVDRAVRLTMLLSQSSVDGFGVLRCLGVCQNKAERRFEFIFDLTSPRIEMAQDGVTASAEAALRGFCSLGSQLQKPDGNGGGGIFRYYRMTKAVTKPLSINQRLTLAKSLAETVQHLHHAQWIHGNITSNNIYFFHQRDQTQSGLSIVRLRSVYLFGFQFTRLTDEYSDQRMWKEVRLKDNFYRHPDRQILQGESGPKKPHTPLHDIYSLGVVLLEIGLGRQAEELVKQMSHLPNELSGQGSVDQADMEKSLFMYIAETFLPEKMGDVYASITWMCLNGDIKKEVHSDSLETELSLISAFRSCVIEPLERLLNVVG